jgi:2'-5' RNA ligase
LKPGIVILSEVRGDMRARILEIQRQFDPKLANGLPPHITVTGSSGMGPFPSKTSEAELRAALEPIARATPPLELRFLPPMKFMQSNIIVLPLDPNGPLRQLHERIKMSGLKYEQPRFTFTPHVTLNFFRELPPSTIKELLSVRIEEPLIMDRISAHRTTDQITSKKILQLSLTGST